MKGLLFFLIAILFSVTSIAQTTQLTVRGFAEGYYRPSTGKMVAKIDSVNYPMICDTGFIQIIDTASNQSIFCTDVLVKTDGYGFCNVPSYLLGKYVKVSIKFRNTFHLISKNVVRMTGNAKLVDLTIPANVCCHFDTTYGVATAYSGDLNDDGSSDGSDFLVLDPLIQNHIAGYQVADLTGDNVLDTADFLILDRNIMAGRYDDFFGSCIVNNIFETDHSFIDVYPNPCKSYFTIPLEGVYENVRVSVFDLMGKEYANINYSSEENPKIDCSYFPSGIYFFRVEVKGSVRQGRVIVENN
jgi:hypothetical protein